MSHYIKGVKKSDLIQIYIIHIEGGEMMSGWVKIHRKILENPVVFKDSDHLAIWIYLLVNATHKDIPVMFKGKKIMLTPGQLLTGRKSISSELSVSESKVHRVLMLFESEQQIEQQTSNKNRIISILNWHKYQTDEQQDEIQMNNKRTTDEQQVNTNKNYKNLRSKEKDLKDIKRVYSENVQLTEIEYQKLVDEHGQDFADECVSTLCNYKGASGKKYKSDYKAILTWVIDKVKERRRPVLVHRIQQSRSQTTMNKLAEMYKQAEEEEKRAQNGGY